MEMIYSSELGLRIAQDAKMTLRSGAFSHYRFSALFFFMTKSLQTAMVENGNNGQLFLFFLSFIAEITPSLDSWLEWLSLLFIHKNQKDASVRLKRVQIGRK